MSEHIVVSNDRYITVPESLQKIGVQFDHNAETVTFDCPRYWDEHDMSTMKVYINYMRPNDSFGAYLCDSVEVDSLDNTIMHFDWTISGHVTEFAGPLSFLVCICDVDQNGDATTHWNSELNTQMYISSGMKCHDAILGRYPDIITHLLNRMNVVEDAADGVAANAAKVEAAMAEAEHKFDGVVEYVNAAAASASAAKISEDNAAASLLEIGDSVSMACEACGTNKPVFIFSGKNWLTAKHLRFVKSLIDGKYAADIDDKNIADFKPIKALNPSIETAEKIKKLIK